MRSHLTLHDVSSYVYTGMNSPTYKNYKQQGYPMGGVKYLLKYITHYLTQRVDLVLAFDSRSFRKDIWPEYKAGRSRSLGYSVASQLEFVYDALLEANFVCHKVDGMEADDVIHSVVEDNRGEYITITMVSSDIDLAHNVDEQCFFEAVNSNVNNVSYLNFRDNVVRGKNIYLNTVTAYKLFFGCSSDNISAFEGSIKNEDLYQGFYEFLCKMPKYSVKISRHPRAMELYLDGLGLPQDELEVLKKRMAVVYPKKIDGLPLGASNKRSIDMDKFAKLLSFCNDRASLKALGLPFYPLSDKDTEMFRAKARELVTGEYAVDRNLPVNEDLVEFEFMDMRDF